MLKVSKSISTVQAYTLLALFAFSLNVTAGKLYKWVDSQGRVSYQDKPPPSSAQSVNESTFDDSSRLNQDSEQPKDDVLVYTVENCDACEVLLLRLKQLEVPVQEHSLSNRQIQQEILGQNKPLQAPTMRINGDFVTDASEQSVIRELTAAGYIGTQSDVSE